MGAAPVIDPATLREMFGTTDLSPDIPSPLTGGANAREAAFLAEAFGGRDGRVVALEDGTGGAYGARVTDGNNLGVEPIPPSKAPAFTSGTVGTTSAELLAEDAGRITFQVMNLDAAQSVHLSLGADAATTDHLRVDPGQTWTLPGGVRFTGAVQAIATAADVKVAVLAF